MKDHTAIKSLLNHPKLDKTLKRKLTQLLDIPASEPPKVILTLSEAVDISLLPKNLQSSLQNGTRFPGLGRIIGLKPSWEILEDILNCDAVEYIQEELPHFPLRENGNGKQCSSKTNREGEATQ